MLLKAAFRGLKSSTGQRLFHNSNKYLQQQQPFHESLASGNNTIYLEQMYESWQQDPKSVHASWNVYFSNLEHGAQPTVDTGAKTDKAGADALTAAKNALRIRELIQSYMKRGHEKTDIDPLHINKIEEQSGAKTLRKGNDKEFDLEGYGFTTQDLNSQILVDIGMFKGSIFKKQFWKVGDLVKELDRIFCGKAGIEYQHIRDREERGWVREQFEKLSNAHAVSKEHKLLIFDRLCKNEMFTNFLKNRFTTAKRFGIEGCDSVISGLNALLDKAAEHKIQRVVFGMPHRGRLNTLTNVLGKDETDIFSEFQELHAFFDEEVWGNSGDVKYHLGTTYDKTFANGHRMNLNILANPSHLEAGNPVVAGNVRAFQDFVKDTTRDKVLAIILHGDAAFAGQGVVYETMQMQDLIDFTVGGTIHVVINNQIGFTTTPKEARTGLYSTDVAKAVDAPIIHVNGDEPELVDLALEFAVEYRQKFKKDVVIDVIGYRRYGHNELDQPSFTQPLMYKIIDKTPPVYNKYRDRLIKEGVLTEEQANEIEKKYNDRLEQSYTKSRTSKFDREKWIARSYENIAKPTSQHGSIHDTGVDTATLQDLGRKICTLPSDLKPHPMIKKIYEQRLKSIEEGKSIDWATGEALAWATLLTDGYGVRLSGQDVERGTFSHRHAVVNDQEKDRKYLPVASILPEEDKHKLTVCNSHLSEYGVLNFEYGYSIANPNYLVKWEAQFGDFANGAQIPIDNFIVSGESKWNVASGLVILLPHGYDGQGPEHSSCRIERLLAASDDDPYDASSIQTYRTNLDMQLQETNIQVCNPSTSANYFHVLRRQLRRNYRKPLLIPSPKKLLKFRGANMNIEEFQKGTRFHRVYFEAYPDEIDAPEKVRRVLFCSGQVYYDLIERRKHNQIKDAAILRIEQLAPFPYDRVKEAIQLYKNASDVIWVQEEHFNGGAWCFVSQRLDVILKELGRPSAKYVGRKPSSSTAAGTSKTHNKELQNHILTPLFGELKATK
eukprot:CAMPEP_0176456844 /NCGR_PEP_ID=MMETSP0127-20121128/31545_1 /TAXON_ID=938130 /ORGANISM="Platyophrya macrostoma, Strain WH" /LENGTH=1003 /DNA_ID=CAMNT_0017846911 /DNA_START=45 /DNA_END=3056 /DNA_ORIENTATION=+